MCASGDAVLPRNLDFCEEYAICKLSSPRQAVLRRSSEQTSAQGRSRGQIFSGVPMPTAIVVDGAYFLRRFKSRYPNLDVNSPADVKLGLMWLAAQHIGLRANFDPWTFLTKNDSSRDQFDTNWCETSDLYRIFFYDCPPLTKRTQLPISKKALDLSQTETARARLAIHRELQSLRKVALRLGRLNEKFGWRVKPDAASRWIASGVVETLDDDDFEINTVQKGVDMRLGLDVSSMAFKKQVDQIVLVAGDADFVPAVKLARREGIDVVLDPMGGTPAQDLVAHVDGVRDVPRPTVG